MRVDREKLFRNSLLALIALFAFALASPVLARDGHRHGGVSIGFSGPGYSIGYSDYGHGRRGWSGAAYGGYGYGSGFGYGGYGRGYDHGGYGFGWGGGYYGYPAYGYPIVDRGYYYDYPRHYPRPARRVVHRSVRYYRDEPRRTAFADDSYRNDSDYRRRDHAYGRASYYDRGD